MDWRKKAKTNINIGNLPSVVVAGLSVDKACVFISAVETLVLEDT